MNMKQIIIENGNTIWKETKQDDTIRKERRTYDEESGQDIQSIQENTLPLPFTAYEVIEEYSGCSVTVIGAGSDIQTQTASELSTVKKVENKKLLKRQKPWNYAVVRLERGRVEVGVDVSRSVYEMNERRLLERVEREWGEEREVAVGEDSADNAQGYSGALSLFVVGGSSYSIPSSSSSLTEKYAEVGGEFNDVAIVGLGGDPPVVGIGGILNNKLPGAICPNGLGLRLGKLPTERGLAQPLLRPSLALPSRLPRCGVGLVDELGCKHGYGWCEPDLEIEIGSTEGDSAGGESTLDDIMISQAVVLIVYEWLEALNLALALSGFAGQMPDTGTEPPDCVKYMRIFYGLLSLAESTLQNFIVVVSYIEHPMGPPKQRAFRKLAG
ncbi:hypothetical protein J3R30DRAFT_3403101 [Lentinula aciculospora]|uniref:Uncharacterized protein n=1 Tax=Lentinula aciculospora TaxID=153920 RepID=A0A9W9AH07_9AGAR|nr:hypothetical protein J3R30DRAFT_3403101 [Lentinula aciculospora]